MAIFSSRGRRRLGAGLALATGVAIVAVIVTAGGSPGSAKAGGGGGAGAGGSGATTATVERRDLVETDTESGTLSYADPQTVYDRLGGTLTWLPKVGAVIKPGGALFKVDGKPVVLMRGLTPAYRDLSGSDAAGTDIEQLNRDLIALGFTGYGIVADTTWQAATTSAVDAFQRSLGEVETGTLSLGQIVFLPGDQLVSTVDATLGSTGGGGSSATGASATVSAPGPEFVALTTSTPTTTAPTTNPGPWIPTPGDGKRTPGGPRNRGNPSRQTLAALLALLRAETAQLKRAQNSPGGGQSPSKGSKSPTSGSPSGGSPSRGSPSSGAPSSGAPSSGSPSAGSNAGNATAILQTASTRLVVTVDLDATKQSEAVVGEHVTVQLPDGSIAGGKVTEVSPVAQTSTTADSTGGGGGGAGGSSPPTATIPVTIALNRLRRARGLDQASVSVSFQQQKASYVLSVPVTALLATAGGGYAVQEVGAPHRLIPVRPGLFAAGDVQVSGPGIHAGLEVTDSQG